jgi:cytochrome c oxidase subunit 1
MSETLGSWHFWLYFIGMNVTFFPMHYAGMLGMPRRIYTYDADQGYTLFNQLSTIGTGILILGTIVGLGNMIISRKRGRISGNDPWGAPTLEWSIPSPPPEYNFAEIPTVTSRYPLWDLKSPELTTEVPHTKRGDERLDVDVGGKHAGHSHVNPANAEPEVPGVVMHEELPTHKTARELGIPMPNPSFMPFVVAFGIVLMFSGLLFMSVKTPLAIAIILAGTTIWVGALYNWLLTPLEDAH